MTAFDDLFSRYAAQPLQDLFSEPCTLTRGGESKPIAAKINRRAGDQQNGSVDGNLEVIDVQVERIDLAAIGWQTVFLDGDTLLPAEDGDSPPFAFTGDVLLQSAAIINAKFTRTRVFRVGRRS